MADAYYSPRLDKSLISPLYHAARNERIPMTRLASRLVAEGLRKVATAKTRQSPSQEPPATSSKQAD